MTNRHDPTDLAGQQTRLAEKRERDKEAARLEEEDITWLMSSKRGRRIVFRLLGYSGIYDTSFNTNSQVTAFNEGRRNEGLRLLGQVSQFCPENYLKMLREKGK